MASLFPVAGRPKCGGCVSRGEEALMAVKGVKGASVNLAAGTATVTVAGEERQ